jgi:hypothetical protein
MLSILPAVDSAEGDLKFPGELLLGDVTSLTDLAYESREIDLCLGVRFNHLPPGFLRAAFCTRSYSGSYMKSGD